MSVRIVLSNPHTFYTNLDPISGRIILSLPTDETISAITVKLEGESRTILMRPPPSQNPRHPQRRDQRQAIATENHKILYKVQQVFPGTDNAIGGSYTLRAGSHEYPFRFKLPFNNSCVDPGAQQVPGAGFGLRGLQQLQYRHVKRTLPPSLTGFPGEAEIRYYVKVTVQRPSLFKENRRSAVGFRFLPIEPPRASSGPNEVYAMRPFLFQTGLAGYPTKKGGMFGKKKSPELSNTPPKGEVDARLPSPAVLTCNEPIPLRLIVRKKVESPEDVYLTSLQIQLIGSTEVRAQDVVRTETSTWVLLSATGLMQMLGTATDAVGTETVLDSRLWEDIPLPNTVAPSFGTCNLTRRYELEVRVGLGFGAKGEVQVCLSFFFPRFVSAGLVWLNLTWREYGLMCGCIATTNHPPPPLPNRDLLRHLPTRSPSISHGLPPSHHHSRPKSPTKPPTITPTPAPQPRRPALPTATLSKRDPRRRCAAEL
jgi:hypothetical protein